MSKIANAGAGLGAVLVMVVTALSMPLSSSAYADGDAPLLVDLDDLSFDLSHYREEGVTGLDFVGVLPVPQDVTVASKVHFALGDDGMDTPSITTQGSASYVLSPNVATRWTYINHMDSSGDTQNLIQLEAALNTACMGRFDVKARGDVEEGWAKLKSITWHIPKLGVC